MIRVENNRYVWHKLFEGDKYCLKSLYSCSPESIIERPKEAYDQSMILNKGYLLKDVRKRFTAEGKWEIYRDMVDMVMYRIMDRVHKGYIVNMGINCHIGLFDTEGFCDSFRNTTTTLLNNRYPNLSLERLGYREVIPMFRFGKPKGGYTTRHCKRVSIPEGVIGLYDESVMQFIESNKPHQFIELQVLINEVVDLVYEFKPEPLKKSIRKSFTDIITYMKMGGDLKFHVRKSVEEAMDTYGHGLAYTVRVRGESRKGIHQTANAEYLIHYAKYIYDHPYYYVGVPLSTLRKSRIDIERGINEPLIWYKIFRSHKECASKCFMTFTIERDKLDSNLIQNSLMKTHRGRINSQFLYKGPITYNQLTFRSFGYVDEKYYNKYIKPRYEHGLSFI